MTAENNPDIPDVQSYRDRRDTPIHRVGIRDIKHPVSISDRAANPQTTVGNWLMTVALPAQQKGTHMSRFTQLLTDNEAVVYTLDSFSQLCEEMIQRLDSKAGTLSVSFSWFVAKRAPVSEVVGKLDYNVSLRSEITAEASISTTVTVVIPVTTLCPCSKEISAYGAHNQRSHVTIEATVAPKSGFFWEELIDIAEAQASSELYSQLKRSDEKHVTERAYDNPKFVEDLVRDIAIKLNAEKRIERYRLEVENFESIHNHSAYAVVVSDA